MSVTYTEYRVEVDYGIAESFRSVNEALEVIAQALTGSRATAGTHVSVDIEEFDDFEDTAWTRTVTITEAEYEVLLAAAERSHNQALGVSNA